MTDLAKKAKAQQWYNTPNILQGANGVVKNPKKIMLFANEDDDTPISVLTIIYDPVNGNISAVDANARSDGSGFGNATGQGLIPTEAIQYLFNGSSFDRTRSNVNLQSVADTTTATYTGPDIHTYNAQNILVLFNVSAFSDTSYTPEVDWKDGAGNYRVLWQQKTAKTGAADTILLIGPNNNVAQIVASATVGDAAFASTDSATANELIQINFPVMPIIRLKVTKVHAAGAFTGNFQVIGSGL